MLNIKSKTIRLQQPLLLSDNRTQRIPFSKNEKNENLILLENTLRKLAYKNTSIKTDESFFDDSDMRSDYYLIIIYNKKSNTPLLSARYYYDKSVIANCLKGDKDSYEGTTTDLFNPINLPEEDVFLIDRMSGNKNNSAYRKNWTYIHLLFYIELYLHNKNRRFLAMARKERFDKLLTKYLKLGLEVVGVVKHKGKEHWVLAGDLRKSYLQMKKSTLLNMVLAWKDLLFKLKLN